MTGIRAIPAATAVALIRLYQLALSPLLGPSCRFSPSCSHYGMAAIGRHGLLRGLWLTLTRLGRCHPWGGCGHDPVPARFRWWPAPSRSRSSPSGPLHDQ